MDAFRNVFNGIKNTWHSETQSDDIKMSDFDFILETGVTYCSLWKVISIANPFNCWKLLRA